MSIKLGKKLTGLALCIALSAAGVYANTLSEVQINAADSGYAIVLKTDSEAQMKKVISSPDKMYIELKDVQASDELNTIYNNVANIENVTIQPMSKNDLKITLQGKDISSSKILFEDIKTVAAPVLSDEESIELNPPVVNYTPVYDNSGIEEVDQTANPQVNSALTAMNIDREKVVTTKNILKKAVNKAGDSNILIALGILALCAMFMFKPQKEQKQQIKIGLSQSLKDSNAQRELAIARKTAAPAASLRYANTAKSNYGMNAYKQSLKNPYMTANTAPVHSGVSGIPRKPIASRKAPATVSPMRKAEPKMSALNAPIQNPIQTSQVSNTVAQRTTANIDSVKFLESITKIYEKNGRQDLAKGLKDNLKKVRTVPHGI